MRSWKPSSHEQTWDLGKMHQALPWVRGHRKRENSSLRKHSDGETDDKQGKKANVWSVLGGDWHHRQNKAGNRNWLQSAKRAGAGLTEVSRQRPEEEQRPVPRQGHTWCTGPSKTNNV